MSDVIVVEHCRKTYGSVVAVEDVTFSVARGEIFGLLGPNGAGKTTTIECLQGLRSRDSGQVEILGIDPELQPGLLHRRVGSQLQSSGLPDRLRIGEAIRLFGSVHHRPIDVTNVLEAWGLTELRSRPFAALSGGQRQRVFLALALLGEPEVVFLDELTAGLDPWGRRATWDLIQGVRDRGATVVLVTHFMEEAEALCDRVAVVNRGRVVALDRPGALVAQFGGDIRMTFDAAGKDMAFLADVAGVSSVNTDDKTTTVFGQAHTVITVAAALAQQGLFPVDFRTHYPTLDDVFLALTGRTLRGDTDLAARRAALGLRTRKGLVKHVETDDLDRDQAAWS